MMEELKKQSFKNEAEEAEWWDKKQDAIAEEFENAVVTGILGRGTAAKRGNTPTTTIRLAPEDIARARSQAERRGLKYQTYLKMLIHEALQRADFFTDDLSQEQTMKNERLFVEQRSQGDYAVRRPNSERASAVRPTQAEAIERARELNPGTSPSVERVRRTTAGKPDKWRRP
jgi:predicted DNA binding CopG/RHH family protein